jgi:protoheme IX farnesyltransferase
MSKSQTKLPYSNKSAVSSVKDFFQLLKPRVMSLAIFTAICGMILSPNRIHPVIGFISVLCIALGAGAAGVINMWYEKDLDLIMSRTQNRPLPKQRIHPQEALNFGVFLGVFSVILLYLSANLLAASLLATSILFYIFVYTVWLKKKTYQNIVIGGVAGSIPPMIGWAVIENNISLFPFLLFLIIFFWTPPHFWCLALFCNEDYKKANIPMLPLIKGTKITKINILVYTLILSYITLTPYLYGFVGKIYFIITSILNIIFIVYALILFKKEDKARLLFRYSIIYLFTIFLTMISDKVTSNYVLY